MTSIHKHLVGCFFVNGWFVKDDYCKQKISRHIIIILSYIYDDTYFSFSHRLIKQISFSIKYIFFFMFVYFHNTKIIKV